MSYIIGGLTREQIISITKKMFAQNEANDKEKYKIEKIKIAESGYAFGLCQHDCGKRADARKFIKECLKRTNVSVPIIKEIMKILADSSNDLSKYEIIVNQALAENKNAIDEFDNSFIAKEVDHVYEVITSLDKDPKAAKVALNIKNAIIASPQAFLQLVDYNNQFGLNETGPMIEFLKGQSVERKAIGKDNISIDASKISQDILGQIRHFINEYTKYGIQHLPDCSRRQGNIDKLQIPAPIDLPGIVICRTSETSDKIVVGCPGGIRGDNENLYRIHPYFPINSRLCNSSNTTPFPKTNAPNRPGGDVPHERPIPSTHESKPESGSRPAPEHTSHETKECVPTHAAPEIAPHGPLPYQAMIQSTSGLTLFRLVATHETNNTNLTNTEEKNAKI